MPPVRRAFFFDSTAWIGARVATGTRIALASGTIDCGGVLLLISEVSQGSRSCGRPSRGIDSNREFASSITGPAGSVDGTLLVGLALGKVGPLGMLTGVGKLLLSGVTTGVAGAINSPLGSGTSL